MNILDIIEKKEKGLSISRIAKAILFLYKNYILLYN